MKFYIQFAINVFRQNTAYKTNAIISILSQFLQIFVQISVWVAIFRGKQEVSSNDGFISLDDMINYILLTTLVSLLVGNSVIQMIDNKIKTGSIAVDIIKPKNLQTIVLVQTASENLFRLMFQLIPILIIVILFYGLHIPENKLLPLFVISLMNAFVLHFIISYIVGLLGFWYLSIWHLQRFMDDMIKVFSGVYVPLWFFPDFLNHISIYLPFRHIYYSPITIFLGRETMMGGLEIIGIQIFWIAVLYVVMRVVWTFGIKRLVIHGG